MVKTENQLIDGLNSGKTQLNNVGKELMSSMNSGQSSQKSNSKKAAADNSAAASGTRSKSNEHKMLVKAMLNRQMLERILKKEMRRILEVS